MNSAPHRGRPRVALLIESSRGFGRGLLLGVARYVREHGPWSIFLQERSLGDVSPAWLKNWSGDGIIARVENLAMAQALRRLQVPIVDLRCALPRVEFPCVRPNDAAIADLAVEHLLERGFRNFAFCGFEGIDYSDCRRDSFIQRLSTAGFRCEVFRDPDGPVGGGTLQFEEHGLKYENRVADWLKNLPKPVGLMTCNDIRGQQVLNACRDVRLSVPDEVAVVGVDNDDVLCELSDPPLTSVVPNSNRIGYEAAALMDRMMAGKKPPSSPVFVEPEGLVTRRSTEVLAIDDRHIASAVRFIREHACEGIDVTDVLKAVPLSRSALERRFARALGRSPKEEILRVRLNRARQLLAETDFPLSLVAEKIGLEHAEYLNVIFKKKTGMTPGQFRAGGRAMPPEISSPPEGIRGLA
ncbi:MAG TPA: DNA-binding transcriptional regulator [Candidatus Dormibacteraeota bacterium]|nr:DNA-binding transcriptional regulator [Candidatus Dormibacteraeota bacterium]